MGNCVRMSASTYVIFLSSFDAGWGFRIVWPTHFHLLLFTSFSTVFVLSLRMLLLDNKIRNLRMYLLLNVCTLFSVYWIILHVSELYCNTDLTFDFNILSLVFDLICFAFHVSQSEVSNSGFLDPNLYVFFCVTYRIDLNFLGHFQPLTGTLVQHSYCIHVSRVSSGA